MPAPPVPREFLGQAGAFRNRIGAENAAYLVASCRMMAPIEARIGKYPSRYFRPETLLQFEHDWREHMPQAFCIDLATEWHRHGVIISERRIGVAEFHDEGWREGYAEPKVSLGDVTMTLNRKVARVTFGTKAIVSVSALAAWFRWGWDSSDAALILNDGLRRALDRLAGDPPR